MGLGFGAAFAVEPETPQWQRRWGELISGGSEITRVVIDIDDDDDDDDEDDDDDDDD